MSDVTEASVPTPEPQSPEASVPSSVAGGPTPAAQAPAPAAELQSAPAASQSSPWVVQMTYNMLRDLAARGRAGVQKRKYAKFDKILAFLDTHGKVTNHEVAHLLYVSHDTASRYLAQLEKEGELKRVGHTGHAVYYIKP